jgi:putative ABC transport system substrate-binding protein
MVRRRAVLALICGAVTARRVDAQQPRVPTIGVLFGGSRAVLNAVFPAFLAGLGELGYRDGHNIAIEYRTAEGRYQELPAMASELVSRNTDVLVSLASPASLAAKAAAPITPVIFSIAADPVALGLVASLSRPGGNLTGATFLAVELTAKQLELVRQFSPNAATVGFLINPDAPDAAAQTSRAQEAARALGLTLAVVNARAVSDLEPAFAALAQRHVGALLIGGDEFFASEAARTAELAMQYRLPAIFGLRLFAAAGGLVSYGASLTEAVHQAGVYAAKVLKGAKPADLPVVQISKFELVINLKTAKVLGLTVPPVIMAGADELIE